MKKLFTVLFAALLFTGFANAQNGMALGVGVNVALPMGTFGDVAGTGIGGTAMFEMDFTPQLTGTATAGYISWGGKDFGQFSYNYSAIPILVGAKYFFMPDGGVYGQAQLGLYMFSVDTEVPSFSVGGVSFGGSTSATNSEFAISLGGGYEIPVSSNMDVDISAAYIIISDLGHIGIRGGVKFGL